jgi:hypothetical protein
MKIKERYIFIKLKKDYKLNYYLLNNLKKKKKKLSSWPFFLSNRKVEGLLPLELQKILISS